MDNDIAESLLIAIEENTNAQAETARALNSFLRLVTTRDSSVWWYDSQTRDDAEAALRRIAERFGPASDNECKER